MQKQINLLLLVLFCLGLLSACAVKKTVLDEDLPREASLAQRAGKAWDEKSYMKSETLYSDLLEKGELSGRERLEALKRLAISALNNQHYYLALKALNKWADLSPAAEKTWSWQEKYQQALLKYQGTSAYAQYVNSLLKKESFPWKLKVRTGLSLTSFYLKNENFKEVIKTQKLLYNIAQDKEARVLLEDEFRKLLKNVSDKKMAQIVSESDAQETSLFPFSLITWEQVMRELEKDEGLWPGVWQTCRKIISSAQLANIEELESRLEELEEKLGVPIRKLALLVPLSGNFKDVGWEIARGASMAQWQKVREGERLHIKLINSASDNWMQSLQDLSSEYKLIGGPLRFSIWEKILKSKELEKRSFFAFLSTLGSAEEGKQAWRFFSSPRDQVKPLLELASKKMGIKNVAILYPDERYGLHMAEAFWRETAKQGVQVTGLDSYPPQKSTEWSKIVSHFLRVDQREELQLKDLNLNSSTTINEPDFKAVFIPDSLSRAQLLVPEFFYYDEDRLLFLGPELWSQALCSDQSVEQNYFQLAVMPGAWWPENPAPELQKLKKELQISGLQGPDFWVALGYDFIRFAFELGALPAAADSRQINQKLHQSGFSNWTLAPFAWDQEGKVNQELFLFQPQGDKLERADADSIIMRRESIRFQHVKRIINQLKSKEKEAEQAANKQKEQGEAE